MLQLVCTLLFVAGLQTPAVDRSRAEALARSGQTAEALDLFQRVVERDPSDVEARLWVGRLLLRLGRTADAEATFRAVLAGHPTDIDGRIGLATALTRRDQWQAALTILHEVEPVAGENADLFAALARAYRRGGDDPAALRYFTRARALSPDDPDLVMGYEAVARTNGHWIAIDGFHQGGASKATSGTIEANLRVMPRLHIQASARTLRNDDQADATAGAGIFWRMARKTTLLVRGLAGPDNVAIVQRELSAEVIHYAGAFELGWSARDLRFEGAHAVTTSFLPAWNPNDRWRLDGRYTLSRSSFDGTSESNIDQSIVIRNTWQAGRRVALLGTYAYGIESFRDLTVNRLRSLGANTVAGGLRVDVPSLTRINVTWEHQWRSNDTSIDRVTVGFVQVIP